MYSDLISSFEKLSIAFVAQIDKNANHFFFLAWIRGGPVNTVNGIHYRCSSFLCFCIRSKKKKKKRKEIGQCCVALALSASKVVSSKRIKKKKLINEEWMKQTHKSLCFLLTVFFAWPFHFIELFALSFLDHFHGKWLLLL